MSHREKYIAKTLKGLEPLLVKELADLGAENVEILNRGASFRGGRAMMYKVNLASRLSLRVLVPIASFEARDAETLYRRVKNFDWSMYLDNKMTFAIDPVVHSPHFKNSFFVAQKVKDAIADRFRERTSLRPSVNKEAPDLAINVHISGSRVSISLDSSGGSLHKRGYRMGHFEAPLNEVLAAGMLMMTGWEGERPFLDPMCGSGTLAIEAAMMAAGIPTGFFRKQYGFENWKEFDRELLEHVARGLPAEREVKVPIIARDISPEAVDLTRRQLKRMELDHLVKCEILDFKSSPVLENACIVVNPPYDERIRTDDIEALYGMIGSTLKHSFPGSDAWILSSSGRAMKKVGLKASRKVPLLNGSMECSFSHFKTFKGNWKEYKSGVEKKSQN